MGHGHAHGDVTSATLAKAPRVVLSAILVVAAVATIIGLVWLWPDTSKLENLDNPYRPPTGVRYFDARVTALSDTCSGQYGGNQGASPCRGATIVPDGGTFAGKETALDLSGPAAKAGLQVGDSVKVMELPSADGQPAALSLVGVNRHTMLLVLCLIFVIAVVAVARWKGAFAIIGLAFAGLVLLKFMLPALLVGENAIAVALVGSTAIMFVVLYVAHGISWRTSAAFAGTLIGLLVTAALGVISVRVARLHGMDENALFVSQIVGNLNFSDLLACALVIAGLGALNDVTITQASAVWEIRAAAPDMSRRQVFTSGMRIGRDHIASTIYTIVFAYAGAALTMLLLLQFYQRPLLELITTEEFGAEIVRTLATSIGLVLSVPITTGIAALTLGPSSLTPVEPHHSEPDGDGSFPAGQHAGMGSTASAGPRHSTSDEERGGSPGPRRGIPIDDGANATG